MQKIINWGYQRFIIQERNFKGEYDEGCICR